MYFNKITIENTGPIKSLDFAFGFDDSGKPKPLVIVGENGSGKSIFLAHLVNAAIAIKQRFFDDVEVDKGKVYKYRSPAYITSGETYSFAKVELDSGVVVSEIQLNRNKKDFETAYGYSPAHQEWNHIPDDQASVFWTNLEAKLNDAQVFVKNQCLLYFPVNRYEDPAWLNYDNLTNRVRYHERSALSGISNRNLIAISPLRENQSWLLDLLLDRQLYDLKIQNVDIQAVGVMPLFLGFNGRNAVIYESIVATLRVILREPQGSPIRLGIGPRENRQISIMRGDDVLIPNLFQLSTGEALLFNLALSIIRDFDLSGAAYNNISEIVGCVIIDEVDAHLHTAYQNEVLPELIAAFPKVQFVLTAHSPLFLLGLEKKAGKDLFDLLELPVATRIDIDQYSDFSDAYEAFKATKLFLQDVESKAKKLAKPVLYVEGGYDIRYIKKAATLLGREDLLSVIEIEDGDGAGNLDKIWRAYDCPVAFTMPNKKTILLFDCDTKKPNGQNGNVFKRTIPSVDANPVKIGIENLFGIKTLLKVQEKEPQFIDFEPGYTKRERGVDIVVPERYSVNKNEKGNLCTWLCDNGTTEDFAAFETIFSLIKEIIET